MRKKRTPALLKITLLVLLLTTMLLPQTGCGFVEWLLEDETEETMETSPSIETSEGNKEDAQAANDTNNHIPLYDNNTSSTTDVATEAIDPNAERISFSTLDISGNTYTSEDMKGAKVVMINFWEPWCGPCVNEMPELEQLYEDYKDEGFLIIGMYSSTDYKREAQSIVLENNISYPILEMDHSLDKYTTEYVPTTFFVDGNGVVLSSESYVGSNSYREWEKILKEYLE